MAPRAGCPRHGKGIGWEAVMGTTETLEGLAKKWLPAWAAREAKRAAVWPRYWAQRKACREGFRLYGDRYPQKVLFVAGMPKSGTTWLEKMIASFPGFHDLLIPDVAAYELKTGGSHDYELPSDMFERFDKMLVLTKMHVHGSRHNADVLKKAGVKHVVLYRDLRDVAISYHFYVKGTPWHPEHARHKDADLQQGLRVFAERMLDGYVEWVRSWEKNRDPVNSLAFKYEDMLQDANGVMMQIARHYQLSADEAEIKRIVEANSFQNLSKGRAQGQESGQSFFRKGVAGDWRNQFSPELREVYKKKIGAFLIEAGYERSMDW